MAANAALESARVDEAARLIKLGLETGRICKGQEKDWSEKFAGDHITAANSLIAIAPGAALKRGGSLSPVSLNLTTEREQVIGETQQERMLAFNSAVEAIAKRDGLKWKSAWEVCKTDPKTQHLWKALSPG